LDACEDPSHEVAITAISRPPAGAEELQSLIAGRSGPHVAFDREWRVAAASPALGVALVGKVLWSIASIIGPNG
jgi:hypothetical protein